MIHFRLVTLYLSIILQISVLVAAFDLTIIHTNDCHARYEQTNKYTGACSEEQASQQECYGGYARLKTKVSDIRANYDNVLLLDAGDQYQGTLWFYYFGGTVTSYFMNLLGYDIMAFGNHEFDNTIMGLVPFLDNVTFPVVSCNIDASNEPNMVGKYTKSVIKTLNNEKIGIIGYTTAKTPSLSSPGQLIFSDEVESIKQEVAILQASGVNKIIALGHAGITVDKKIAAEVSGVDIVVGGHTNTFLYSGAAPDLEAVEGDYPTVITQSDGSKVLVVQAYAHTKYLGFLQVTFDDAGNVDSWSGNPILLDSSIPQDSDLLSKMAPWQAAVGNMTDQPVGRTIVFLNGDSAVCRLKECNMGNLIADGMVTQNLRHPDEIKWNSVSISLMNSGGIRNSLERGQITVGHILDVQPYRNYIDIVELTGEHLLGALEWAVFDYDPGNRDGKFLQVSGLRVEYDVSRPNNQRVVGVMTMCTECTIPEYVPLVRNKTYEVILPNFIRDGGDGYIVIRDNYKNSHELGDLDTDIFVEYVKNYSPIRQAVEGRIKFVTASESCIASEAVSIMHHIYLSTALFMLLLAAF